MPAHAVALWLQIERQKQYRSRDFIKLVLDSFDEMREGEGAARKLTTENMGHKCCSKQKVKKGLWSPEEDEKLLKHITTHGHGSWSSVPKLAGLQRCGKSCRLRWINYLRPDLRRGSFSEEEEQIIIDCHRILGNR
ncbi:hypothetical protein Patl1_19899 [Pistacia atlantica]|uniref:Uncharacterized protein n=1 Tax=Pistacia atlantica TaxID=434234 RepID=A0ACC1BJC3_9ROSI|nr:hypothetical protein Patl1_19899 [Pistacia atlantica]